MATSINWKDRIDLQVALMEQGYAVKIHLAKGNKDSLWQEMAHVLNAGKFKEFTPVQGPAYKKKFSSVLLEVKKKFAIDAPGSNLSGLDEHASELEKIGLKILKEVYDKKDERQALTIKAKEKQSAMLCHEDNVLGTSFGTTNIASNAGVINNSTVVNVTETGATSAAQSSSRKRKAEPVEDPFFVMMDRFLKLEEMKLKMAMAAANVNVDV